MIVPAFVASSLSSVLFLPMRWNSKNCLEQVSPYLNQLATESWWFSATWSYKVSAKLPCDADKMFLTVSSLGSRCSWISASWIFWWKVLVRAPLARFFSFAKLAQRLATLMVAASSQAGQSVSRSGVGSVPSQALRRTIVLSSSLNNEVSK